MDTLNRSIAVLAAALAVATLWATFYLVHLVVPEWSRVPTTLTGAVVMAACSICAIHAVRYGFVLQPKAFMYRVQDWMRECFGTRVARDRVERNHRFLEESLELVQALGCTCEEAHTLVEYVFGRPVGDPDQEAGGVMLTLHALCYANGMDAERCGDLELERVWGKIEDIRAKQAAKPKFGPLPE